MIIALDHVLDFHRKMKLTIGDPREPDVDVDVELRHKLIREEFTELTRALFGKKPNGEEWEHHERIREVADALGDIIYTCVGAAVAWGIDISEVFEEIHASNMTKSPDHRNPEGKILKGPDYRPPDISAALKRGAALLEEVPDFWDRERAPEPDLKQILQEEPETLDDAREALAEAVPEEIHDEDEPTGQINAMYGEIHAVKTARNSIAFECVCGRHHDIPLALGTRGGFTNNVNTSCMCGRALVVIDRETKGPIVRTDLKK